MKENERKSGLAVLFGSLPMGWPVVIGMAVLAAVVTVCFLLFPVFKGTSFERMGIYPEAWVLPAVVIMANCKKPLESALKVFVFFLISQPLIYLLQVPFNWQGWGIFMYYRYWFMITLLTFPAAFIGWYITKRSWLSVLIFAPVLGLLGYIAFECGSTCALLFPKYLIAALFCIAQIVLYCLAFFPKPSQKAVGLLIPAAVIAFLLLRGPGSVNIAATDFLPGDPVLTQDAKVVMEETEGCEVGIESTGEDSMIYIHGTKYGTYDFAIEDGDRTYTYSVRIYYNKDGSSQIEVTER